MLQKGVSYRETGRLMFPTRRVATPFSRQRVKMGLVLARGG